MTGAALAVLHAQGVAVCAFHRLTGLPCLTCGTSRAASLLLSGDPLAALRLQPLAVAAGVAAGVWCVCDAAALLLFRRTVRAVWRPGEWRGCVIAGTAAALANWAYLLWRGV